MTNLFLAVKSLSLKGLFGCLSVMIIGAAVASCGDKSANRSDAEAADVFCILEPTPIKVYFQPLGDFTEAEARAIAADFGYDDNMLVGYETYVLPPQKLSDDMKNDAKTRYSATKVLDSLKAGGKGVCFIGLTHKDISMPLHNVPDYGIQGLSYIGSHKAVASTFRTKSISDFKKVVYHEFCHAYYKLPHCPYNDPTCIVKDANGKPYWKNKTRLCEKCRIEAARELFGTPCTPCD